MAAAMAFRLQPERRIFHSHRFPRLFFSSSSSSSSSSSNGDDKATINDDENKSSASSIFSDIKSRLRQHSPPPPPRRPYLYSSPPPERPTKLASLDEIRKNLEEFRSSSAAPDPHKKPSSSPLTSFQEIYNTTYGSRSENPDGENAETLSLDAIRESLRRIPKSESPIFNRFRGPRTVNPTLLNSLKDGLNVRKEEGASLGSAPLAIFRKELEERERSEMDSSSSSSSSQTEFLRAYSHKELGERLRSLRPEKAKSTKDWFSLEELSERLKELRKIHEKESRGGYFSSLRESLHQIKEADDRKKQASIRSPLSIFSPLLGLPAQPYLALPPKEQLVEKYFHPDNMSSAEKLKLELKKVRDEFKMSESDCGSSRVQIAQLTTKIKHLSTALHKKDKHSRKGLQEMVQRRKKLLKYLRRTDWDSYTFVLSKLGLRDNPDYKH